MAAGRVAATTLLIALVTLSGCVSSTARTASDFTEFPESNGTVLLMEPDVALSMLVANGLREPRADWSETVTGTLAEAFRTALRARGLHVVERNRTQAHSERQVQLIKLVDAVTASILTYHYNPDASVPAPRATLPTKRGAFDWTLGPGATALADGVAADYALLIRARGTYQSGGKMIVNLAVAALRGKFQTGEQTAFIALVHLGTGDVLWTNYARVTPIGNMRRPGGASAIADLLLAEMPPSADANSQAVRAGTRR